MRMTTRANQRLLVVEDDAAMRDFLQSFLSGYGFRLSEASTGQLALELAAKDPPDLILLDLNLPRKDGREVLAEIKADDRLKRIPVVILTTSKAEEDVLKSYNLHANCYVTKPVDLEQFIVVVKSIDMFWLTVVTLPNGK